MKIQIIALWIVVIIAAIDVIIAIWFVLRARGRRKLESDWHRELYRSFRESEERRDDAKPYIHVQR